MNGRCTIDGTIQHVIFQNEENGYTVLRLVTGDGEAVTVAVSYTHLTLPTTPYV